MISGRRHWKKDLELKLPKKHNRRFWFHCASLGEFEMARPVIEQIQTEFPHWEIIISFFSPSGYEERKHFICEGVFYLPFDTRKNAAKWYDIVQPDIAVFVKYEFWLNFMHAGNQRGCNLLGISVLFREGQFFFEPWAGAWKHQLQRFKRIFVQNTASEMVGKQEGLSNIVVAGDIRFDRVIETAAHFEGISEIEQFKGDSQLLVAGSSWMDEEKFLAEYLSIKSWPLGWKWIIVPHDIGNQHITDIKDRFSEYKPILYSELNNEEDLSKKRILIIDNMGLLSRIYRYANAAVIGGAWGKGLHNILEAATFGMPILFGPKHEKFPEAAEGIEAGFCLSAKDYHDFEIHLNRMLGNREWREEAAEKSRKFVHAKSGATQRVLEYLRM